MRRFNLREYKTIMSHHLCKAVAVDGTNRARNLKKKKKTSTAGGFYKKKSYCYGKTTVGFGIRRG